jgi:hypothetical protein
VNISRPYCGFGICSTWMKMKDDAARKVNSPP